MAQTQAPTESPGSQLRTIPLAAAGDRLRLCSFPKAPGDCNAPPPQGGAAGVGSGVLGRGLLLLRVLLAPGSGPVSFAQGSAAAHRPHPGHGSAKHHRPQGEVVRPANPDPGHRALLRWVLPLYPGLPPPGSHHLGWVPPGGSWPHLGWVRRGAGAGLGAQGQGP